MWKLMLLLFIATPAMADVNLHIGLGKNVIRNQFGSHDPFERALSAAYTLDLSKNFYVKPELGGYLAYGEGRKHSLYGGVIAGVRVPTLIGLYVNAGIGPSYVLSPDSVVLTGHFQFFIEMGIGFCGYDICLGGRYAHLSNAGIKMPNRGLDLFQLDLKFKL